MKAILKVLSWITKFFGLLVWAFIALCGFDVYLLGGWNEFKKFIKSSFKLGYDHGYNYGSWENEAE